MTTARMRWPGLNRRSPLNRGLAAYWPMWEGPGSGTIGDLVNPDPKAVRAALAGGMDPAKAWKAGCPSGGYALEFNGISNYIDVSASYSDLPAFTNCVWIYKDASTPIEPVVLRLGTAALQVVDTSTLRYYDGSSSFDTTSQIPDNTWTHIAITKIGTDLRFYVNGKQVGSFSSSLSQPALFRIGWYSNANHYWQGKISSVAIYNRALASSEIQHFYENPNALLTLAPRIFLAAVVGGNRRRRMMFFGAGAPA